jgi:hypothetical protein
MFDKDILSGSFSHRDPMMVFMRRIDRENASKLTALRSKVSLELQRIILDTNSNAPSDSLAFSRKCIGRENLLRKKQRERRDRS